MISQYHQSGQACWLLFLKDFIYSFLERWEGRGKERDRNISVWDTSTGCLSHTPNQGYSPQLKRVPWLGIELMMLWLTAQSSFHWATPARAACWLLAEPWTPQAPGSAGPVLLELLSLPLIPPDLLCLTPPPHCPGLTSFLQSLTLSLPPKPSHLRPLMAVPKFLLDVRGTNHVMWLESWDFHSSLPTTIPTPMERGWRSNQSPVANDLINHTNVMKLL